MQIKTSCALVSITQLFFMMLLAATFSHAQPQSPDTEWLNNGRDTFEQRFSPLDQINIHNVDKLGLAFGIPTDTTRGLEATPLYEDGVLYFSLTWSQVWALDVRMQKVLWKYDPKVPGAIGRKACCDVVNRGVALSGDKVFVGTLDGFLIAIDKKTGAEIWRVKTIPDTGVYAITGAPRIAKNKVIIGNGGAEFGVRGFVSAYDIETGALAWRFYTVPDGRNAQQENPALDAALKTWSKESNWESGGGGTVWDSMAYDPALDLLYVGVGNGSPWQRDIRSPGRGDNLYLSSILALRPDTGELVWHYQTTPGDSWDYTATQHIMLADMVWDGKPRKLLMQAPKNGFYYVLDRATGELLGAKNYVDVTWASSVDLKTGRPIETGKADWQHELRIVKPANVGGHNWQPMALNPQEGLVYIPAIDIVQGFMPEPNYKFQPNTWNVTLDMEALTDMALDIPLLPMCSQGKLIAWDVTQQKPRWEIAQPGIWNGGVLATKGGLVFQGTQDGYFRAYDAVTGRQAWEYKTEIGVIAAPVSFLMDGVQYIALLVGYGGAGPLLALDYDKLGPMNYVNDGRLLVFRLGGTAPPLAVTKLGPPEMPAAGVVSIKVSEQQYRHGARKYMRYCAGCHGVRGKSGGLVPDLRAASKATHAQWDAIVLGGLRHEKGMAGFGDVISLDDSRAIEAYVIEEALLQKTLWQQAQEWVKRRTCLPYWLLP